MLLANARIIEETGKRCGADRAKVTIQEQDLDQKYTIVGPAEAVRRGRISNGRRSAGR
jgi:transcription elongation GreA/GreB family factor